MRIQVLSSARSTIADGIRFYENLEAGLGAYFINSIMADLRSLKIYAGIHQKYNDAYRRMVCKRFPYSIYYQTDETNVYVYAVLDDHRDPKWKEDALDRIGQGPE